MRSRGPHAACPLTVARPTFLCSQTLIWGCRRSIFFHGAVPCSLRGAGTLHWVTASSRSRPGCQTPNNEAHQPLSRQLSSYFNAKADALGDGAGNSQASVSGVSDISHHQPAIASGPLGAASVCASRDVIGLLAALLEACPKHRSARYSSACSSSWTGSLRSPPRRDPGADGSAEA
jgi:hypothetical protein